MDNWQLLAPWVFKGLLGYVALRATRSMDLVRKSVEELNVKVAVVIEKTTNHEKRITTIEKKVNRG